MDKELIKKNKHWLDMEAYRTELKWRNNHPLSISNIILPLNTENYEAVEAIKPIIKKI